jgi:hypothetical protein
MPCWIDLLTPVDLFDQTPAEMLARRGGERVPLVSSCGLGVNSTAGLILLRRLGDRPDAILFADTGGEKPETYAYRETLNVWLADVGFPAITTVRREVKHERQKNEEKYSTLEEECLVKKCLPSIAYYLRSCSEKWKHQPQEKWANHDPACRARWHAGGRVIKAIYYDADEPRRVKHWQDDKYVYWHPLVDYGWGREECLWAIEDAGLPLPPKSSCFFCPEMTPPEILALPPDLLARALAMEGNAELHTIKGLGQHEYSWRDLAEGRVSLPQAAGPPMRCHNCMG